MDLMEENWLEIPEVPVNFVWREEEGWVAPSVEMDLGLLGIWNSPRLSFGPGVKYDEQEVEEIKGDVQYAFEKLILRAAAQILVKRGEGLGPILVFMEEK